MKIEVRHTGGVAIVTPIGTLFGGDETDDLDRELQALANQGNRKLLVDLGRVRICGDRPFGVLARTHMQYRNLGGRMVLCRVTRQVRQFLDIAKLSQMFDSRPTENEALRSFAPGPAPGNPPPGEGTPRPREDMPTRAVDDVLVLIPSGLLIGPEQADRFLTQARRTLQAGNRRLLIDLSHVTYIDIHAVEALVTAHSEYAASGCRLRLFGVNKDRGEPPLDSFPLWRDVYGTEEEAIASFVD